MLNASKSTLCVMLEAAPILVFCAAKVLPLPIITAVAIRSFALPALTSAMLTAPPPNTPAASLLILAVNSELVCAATSIFLSACIVLPIKVITLLPLSLTVAPMPVPPIAPPATPIASAATVFALSVLILILPDSSSPASLSDVTVLPVRVILISLLFAASAASAPNATPPAETPIALRFVVVVSLAIAFISLAVKLTPSKVISLFPLLLIEA